MNKEIKPRDVKAQRDVRGLPISLSLGLCVSIVFFRKVVNEEIKHRGTEAQRYKAGLVIDYPLYS